MIKPKYFRILLFTAVAVGLALLQGCKCHGNCCDYVPVYYLNTGLYPYLFKTGTFWVYKNETTGAIDSEYVYTYTHDTSYTTPRGGPGYCGSISAQEEWEYWCLSFLNGMFIDTNNNATLATAPGEFQFIEETINSTLRGETTFMINVPVNYNYGSIYYKGVLPALTVNGYVYSQVRQFYLDISQTTSAIDSTNVAFYYAANVGLIRKTIYINNIDSINWDLINKHIVQ